MRHPADLPKGLPHGDPGTELFDVMSSRAEGLPPGHRVVGLRQVDGMAHEPGARGRGKPASD